MINQNPYFDVIVKLRDGRHELWKIRKWHLAAFLSFSLFGLAFIMSLVTGTKPFIDNTLSGKKTWQATFDYKSLKNVPDPIFKSMKILKSNITFAGNSTRIKLNIQPQISEYQPLSAKLSLTLENEKLSEYSIDMEKNFGLLKNAKAGPILVSEFQLNNINLDSLKNIKSFKIRLTDVLNRETVLEFDPAKMRSQPLAQVSKKGKLNVSSAK